MNFSRNFLIFSILLSVAGFLVGAFLGNRALGVIIFQTGFFSAGFCAVFIFMKSNPEKFGHLGPEVRLIGSGFGLILTGLLIELILKNSELIRIIFVSFGLCIMAFGIIKSIFRIR